MRSLVVLIPLLAGFALGAAHYARAEGVCVYRPAEVQLEIATVTYDGVDAPLLGVPSTLVLEKPPNEDVGFSEPPTLVLQGRRLGLTETP